MKIFKEGLGEGSTFAGCHPAVNLMFFLFAIGITMFSMSPAFLAVTLVFSWLYSILQKSHKEQSSAYHTHRGNNGCDKYIFHS